MSRKMELVTTGSLSIRNPQDLAYGSGIRAIWRPANLAVGGPGLSVRGLAPGEVIDGVQVQPGDRILVMLDKDSFIFSTSSSGHGSLETLDVGTVVNVERGEVYGGQALALVDGGSGPDRGSILRGPGRGHPVPPRLK